MIMINEINCLGLLQTLKLWNIIYNAEYQ